EAEKALKDIKAGKDFAAAAKEYSIDESTRNIGGDIGFIDRGILKEPLKSTLSRMGKGDISGVVQSGYGFEVLKLTDVRKAKVPPLEDVREGIAKRVKLTKKSDKVKEFYTAMNKDAVVEINKEVLKTLK
ncbi:MAG TPA: peptidylprolyl isomerase, partial [Nitrospirota bacterium]